MPSPWGASTLEITYTIDYVGAVFTITAAVLPDPAWTVFPPASLEYDGTAKTLMAIAGGAGPSLNTAAQYFLISMRGVTALATPPRRPHPPKWGIIA